MKIEFLLNIGIEKDPFFLIRFEVQTSEANKRVSFFIFSVQNHGVISYLDPETQNKKEKKTLKKYI